VFAEKRGEPNQPGCSLSSLAAFVVVTRRFRSPRKLLRADCGLAGGGSPTTLELKGVGGRPSGVRARVPRRNNVCSMPSARAAVAVSAAVKGSEVETHGLGIPPRAKTVTNGGRLFEPNGLVEAQFPLVNLVVVAWRFGSCGTLVRPGCGLITQLRQEACRWCL